MFSGRLRDESTRHPHSIVIHAKAKLRHPRESEDPGILKKI